MPVFVAAGQPADAGGHRARELRGVRRALLHPVRHRGRGERRQNTPGRRGLLPGLHQQEVSPQLVQNRLCVLLVEFIFTISSCSVSLVTADMEPQTARCPTGQPQIWPCVYVFVLSDNRGFFFATQLKVMVAQNVKRGDIGFSFSVCPSSRLSGFVSRLYLRKYSMESF